MTWKNDKHRHFLASKGIISKNDNFRLKEQEEIDLKFIVDKLKKHPAVNEIALFGSRARGTETDNSDYDIMVFCNPYINIDENFYAEIFKYSPIPYDIKFINDSKTYGDIMWVFDKAEFDTDSGMNGTPISSDILEDMKTLWKRK